MRQSNMKRKEFEWIFSLNKKQTSMLKGNDLALLELYNLCDTDSQRGLIKDLLVRFHCFEDGIYNLALKEIANYIKGLGYDLDKTAIVAFCHNSQADSSQEVLQDLKVPIAQVCGKSIMTINRFDKICKKYNSDGIRHFIAVDEFSGSGQTIVNRNVEFINKKLFGATINYCLVAAMSDAVRISKSNGLDIFVAYEMDKGISDYYKGVELAEKIEEMKALEEKLADSINQLQLNDYLFGYGRSEALYSRLYKNIPNNVFPVFWWKKYKNNMSRNTLFERVQDGY